MDHRTPNIPPVILHPITVFLTLFLIFNQTKMKKNIGSADKIIRILVAIIIGGLYFANLISGTTAIILMILAIVFLLTSLVGTCPIYLALGLNSNKKNMNAHV